MHPTVSEESLANDFRLESMYEAIPDGYVFCVHMHLSECHEVNRQLEQH